MLLEHVTHSALISVQWHQVTHKYAHTYSGTTKILVVMPVCVYKMAL